MNLTEQKSLAKKLETQADSLLDEFTKLLADRGFQGVDVLSFAVAPKAEAPRLKTFAAGISAHAEMTGCPTKCVVLPDGRIECKQVC